MADKEIINALECCINSVGCHACPRNKYCDGLEPMQNALDLINRQQAEIERLNNNISAMATTLINSAQATRNEAIKEFAERLKEQAKANEWNGTICGLDIDRLEKEMVGEDK